MSAHFNSQFWQLMKLPGEPQPTDKPTPSSSTPRKPQRLSWSVPAEVDFGTLLNSLPAVVVVEGNQDATPIYTPQLNQRRPGFGDHTLTVTVPGNDEYEEARLSMPLHVKRGKLTVTGPKLMIEVGKPVPTLPCVVEGLVPPDAAEAPAAYNGPPAPSISMSGYPLMPQVNFTTGLAQNYDITVVPGLLKVRPTDAEMEENIGIFRRRTLKLAKEKHGPLFDILDKIKDKRLNLQQDALAELMAQLEADLVESEYVRVTEVTIAPEDGAKIDALETVQFSATVKPAEATEPGIRWSVDDPGLATISETGLLTRAGKAGGPVVVTATSLSRDAIIASATVDIRPRPESIRLEAPPAHIFTNKKENLKAVTEPAEADQRLKWTVRSGKYVEVTPDGEVTIKPPRPGVEPKGTVILRATSLADSTVFEEVSVPFGGLAVEGFRFEFADKRREVEVGDSVTITAVPLPGGVSQDVAWELEDPSMADMTVDGRTVTLRTKAGGTVVGICKALDGGGHQQKVRFKAKVLATGFSTTCPKTDIDITESLQFVPIFVPSDARARVHWTVTPEDGATITPTGKLKPLKAGTVTVTGELEDTPFSHSHTINVTASATTAIGIEHWDTLSPRIDAFAERLMIPQHHLSKAAYKAWKENLRHSLESGATKTLGEMKTELVNLRNQHCQYNHSQWLTKAGFDRKTNCCIRNDGTLNFNNRTFRVHMTMFPTATQFTVGTAFNTLRDSVYRVGDPGFVSMHATLYVSNANTVEQIKVYTSGEDYTSPWTHVQAWANQGINYQQLKTALGIWMANAQNQATVALQGVYNQVHAHDNQLIS